MWGRMDGLLGAGTLLKLAGMIGLNTFVFSVIAYLLALFVHNSSAWSGRGGYR